MPKNNYLLHMQVIVLGKIFFHLAFHNENATDIQEITGQHEVGNMPPSFGNFSQFVHTYWC